MVSTAEHELFSFRLLIWLLQSHLQYNLSYQIAIVQGALFWKSRLFYQNPNKPLNSLCKKLAQHLPTLFFLLFFHMNAGIVFIGVSFFERFYCILRQHWQLSGKLPLILKVSEIQYQIINSGETVNNVNWFNKWKSLFYKIGTFAGVILERHFLYI